jgi:N-acetylmuramoyl-L-alanine amidase
VAEKLKRDSGRARGLSRRQALAGLAALAGGLMAWPALAQTGQELAGTGQDLLAQGQTAKAVATLQEAVRIDPGNGWAWNLLGRAYMAQGDKIQAGQSFQAALRADPNDGYARLMLDMLSQRPRPQAPAHALAEAGHPSRPRRPSSLEEQAGQERKNFMSQGRCEPGSKLIVIDPGHGGPDLGIVGPSGIREKDLTLDVAVRLAKALSGQDGVKAMLTRDADYGMPLWARAAMTGIFGADVFVSLHATAAEDNASGPEFYWFGPASNAHAQAVAGVENGVQRLERAAPGRSGPPGPHDYLTSWQGRRLLLLSRNLAEQLAKQFAPMKPLGRAKAWGAPLAVLEAAKSPAVLFEAGFLTNGPEASALADGSFRQSLAEELAKVLVA